MRRLAFNSEGVIISRVLECRLMRSLPSTPLVLQMGSADACTHRFAFSRDEVNQVAINPKGTLLAAADDAGEIAVIDLAAGTLRRTLRGGHSNICSAAVFRENSPWELLSGGLDAEVVRWDFSGGRPLRRWRLGTWLA